jgi:hypothetical protein
MKFARYQKHKRHEEIMTQSFGFAHYYVFHMM